MRRGRQILKIPAYIKLIPGTAADHSEKAVMVNCESEAETAFTIVYDRNPNPPSESGEFPTVS